MKDTVVARQYWDRAYRSRFGIPFQSAVPYGYEMKLFKQLTEQYGLYTVLEAIDRFINRFPQKYCHITYFYKIFKTEYADIIRMRRVIRYKRLLPSLPEYLREPLKQMINEYALCCHEFASDGDLERKAQLESKMEDLVNNYNRRDMI